MGICGWFVYGDGKCDMRDTAVSGGVLWMTRDTLLICCLMPGFSIHNTTCPPVTFKKIKTTAAIIAFFLHMWLLLVCVETSLLFFCVCVDLDVCSRVAYGSFSLFSQRIKIQPHLQFVLIKQGLHLRAPISCWCLFPFAIYFIPARTTTTTTPCPLNTPTSFSKQKINRLEVTWLPASSFLLCLPPPFFFFPGRTEEGKKKEEEEEEKKKKKVISSMICLFVSPSAIFRKHLMSPLF